MKLLLASPLESKKLDNLTALFITTSEGERGLLKDHAALVAGLKEDSLLRLVSPEGETRIRLGEGSFLRFQNNEAVLVTRSFRPENQGR